MTQNPGHIAPMTQVNGTNQLMTQTHDARLRLDGTGQFSDKKEDQLSQDISAFQGRISAFQGCPVSMDPSHGQVADLRWLEWRKT